MAQNLTISNPANYIPDFSWIGEMGNTVSGLVKDFPELQAIDRSIRDNDNHNNEMYDVMHNIYRSALDSPEIQERLAKKYNLSTTDGSIDDFIMSKLRRSNEGEDKKAYSGEMIRNATEILGSEAESLPLIAELAVSGSSPEAQQTAKAKLLEGNNKVARKTVMGGDYANERELAQKAVEVGWDPQAMKLDPEMPYKVKDLKNKRIESAFDKGLAMLEETPENIMSETVDQYGNKKLVALSFGERLAKVRQAVMGEVDMTDSVEAQRANEFLNDVANSFKVMEMSKGDIAKLQGAQKEAFKESLTNIYNKRQSSMVRLQEAIASGNVTNENKPELEKQLKLMKSELGKMEKQIIALAGGTAVGSSILAGEGQTHEVNPQTLEVTSATTTTGDPVTTTPWETRKGDYMADVEDAGSLWWKGSANSRKKKVEEDVKNGVIRTIPSAQEGMIAVQMLNDNNEWQDIGLLLNEQTLQPNTQDPGASTTTTSMSFDTTVDPSQFDE